MKNNITTTAETAQLNPQQLLDRITFRLLNHKQASALLEERPAVLMGDLCLLFQFDLQHEPGYSRILPVSNTLLAELGLSARELLQLARENTQRLHPAVIDTMEARLGLPDASSEQPTLLVITNPSNFYGAGTILYPGIGKQIAKRLQTEDFLILPSSIHEVLAVPRSVCGDIETLRNMVHEINENEVAPDERLSDNVYELRHQRLLPVIS